MTNPYTYDERILLQEDSATIRVESFMAWREGSRLVHPFGKLQRALTSPLLPSEDDSSIRLVTVSVASRSSQSFNDDASSLHNIPLLNTDGTKKKNLPHFPSGFWLEILAERSLPLSELNSLVDHWRDHRVITTPTAGSIWDREEIHDDSLLYRHQLFLPTTGAAWSADAWQQTMQALLPCGSDFFGVNAMDWSKLLVEGTATKKQFWIQWSQQDANMGLQFQSLGGDNTAQEQDVFQTLPPTLLSEQASCPLATRSIQRLSASSLSNQDSPTSRTTLEQVVRQLPASPNHGRLETWFTTSSSSLSSLADDCQLQIRQKFPHLLAPQWQSLQITTSPDDDDDSTTASVEWDDSDLSAVLRITSPRIPTSMMVSLDFEPVLLSLDDFPGDPNRGRELPPAVATFHCHGTTTTNTTCAASNGIPPLYSNSVLLVPPVPDMSMPFNVLSLSCSLYAYLIGTMITLLVKRSSERIKYRLHPEQKPESKLKRLKSKILSKFQRTTKSAAPPQEEKDESSSLQNDNATKEEETTNDDGGDEPGDASIGSLD
jgi:hypothetical protein